MELIKDSDAEERVKYWWKTYQTEVITKLSSRWEDYYKKYRGILNDNPQRESNVFIPRCFDSIETSVPRLVLGVFNSNPAFKLMPVSKNDVKAAKTLTELLSYYYRMNNFFLTVFNATKSSEIFDTSLIKSRWDSALKRPIHDVIQVGDFFIDPSALTIDTADYCGDRKIRSLEYLRKMEADGIYKNIDKVEAEGQEYKGSGGKQSDILSLTKNAIGLRNPYEYNQGGVNSTTQKKYGKQYEVIECYHNGGGQLTTLAGGVVIRNDENPLAHKDFPYSPIITVPDCQDFFGIGLIQPIRFLQDELNDFNNAMMDWINRSLSPINKVSMSEHDRYKTWKIKSGAVWLMNDIKTGHEFDRLPPLPPESWAMFGNITSTMDRTLALTDYQRGVKTGGDTSATESAILAQAADNRLKLKLYMLQHCLKRVVKQDVANIQAFVDERFVVRLTEDNEGFAEFTKDGIKGELDVFPTGSMEIVAKETKRAQYIGLMGTIFNPQVVTKLMLEGTNVKLTPLVKQILETFEAKEIDEILEVGPEPEAAPMGTQAPGMGGMGGAEMPPASMPETLKGIAEESAPGQMPPTGG